MERLIEETIEYTSNRKTFGRPILSNQVVQFRLAELRTEIEALRSLLYRAVCKGFLKLYNTLLVEGKKRM